MTTVYSVVEKGAARTVVQLPDYVDDDPSDADERDIEAMASATDCLAFDLSATRAIPTSWLRMMWRVTQLAKGTDKRIFVVGVKPEVRRKADLIALEKQLHMRDTLEDAK